MIDSVDAATASARRSGNFDATWRLRPGDADPDRHLPDLATSGARNYGGYSNPRLDLILANGLKATSIQARSTLYRVAQQIIPTTGRSSSSTTRSGSRPSARTSPACS